MFLYQEILVALLFSSTTMHCSGSVSETCQNGRYSIRSFRTVYIAEEQHLLQLLVVLKGQAGLTKTGSCRAEQSRAEKEKVEDGGWRVVRLRGDHANVGEKIWKYCISLLSSQHKWFFLTRTYLCHVRSLPRLILLDQSSNSQRLAFTQPLSS